MSSRVIISGFDPAGPFAGLLLPPRFRKRQAETRFKQNWKMTALQYWTLMREFVGPEHQRGSIIMAAITPSASGSGVVVLTNHSFLAFALDPADATAAVRFDANGTLSRGRNGSFDSPFNGQWWNKEPDTGIGSNFAVRALSGGTGTWTVAAAADDAWIAMGGNREWNVFQDGNGTNTAIRTFEVGSEPTGPADDAASMTVSAEVNP